MKRQKNKEGKWTGSGSVWVNHVTFTSPTSRCRDRLVRRPPPSFLPSLITLTYADHIACREAGHQSELVEREATPSVVCCCWRSCCCWYCCFIMLSKKDKIYAEALSDWGVNSRNKSIHLPMPRLPPPRHLGFLPRSQASWSIII